MKHFSIVFLSFIFLNSFGQPSKTMVIGTIDTVYSHILKENRQILVHLPMTAPDGYVTNPKYPVIYVLDGDFLPTVAITESLSGGSGNFNYPKMIVVAITNTDRTRDFTPTHSTDGTVMPGFLLQTSGGGDNFNTFLEKELIPYIDTHYPAAPYRVLIGHSLGGLIAIKNLTNPKSIFNAFIAIDPSMWWDKQNFLKETEHLLQKNTVQNKSLYLAIANTMDEKFTLQTVLKDTTSNTLPIRSILELDNFIKQEQNNGLKYQSKYYSDYDHGGIPLVAKNDGLPFIFDFYGINFPFPDFFNPDFKDDDILVNHYKMVSEKIGYTISPPGGLIGAISSQLTDMKQYERAYKYLQLNMANYPNSYLPYNAMGRYYEKTGDTLKAKEYYQKALNIKDVPSIRTKIETLK